MSFINPNTGHKTSFNELEVTQNESYVEGSAIYDLIPANFREYSANGGGTTATNRLMKVSTGTSVGGYGAVQSFRALSHKLGKSVSARFSGYFSGSAASSEQGIGLISIGEELSFGYQGATFGIWNRYGGLSEVRTITVTGASGGSTDLTLTLNTVIYTIPLTAGTTAHNAQEIADWLNANQSVWSADQISNTVIISARSDGARSGTYTFSHASATGSIAQNKAGVTKTSDFIAQADWNGEALTETLDPTKGQLYHISYQNMSFGVIEFYIMDANLNKYIVVHTIKSPNSTTTQKIPNPSMRAGFYAYSTGSTTNLDVYSGGFSIGNDGTSHRTRNPRSYSSTVNLSTTNATNVLTLRNRNTYNYYNNQVTITPLRVSVASEVNKNVIIEIRTATAFNANLEYISAGTNLVADVSTTASTITGGTLIDSFTVPPNGGKDVDLTNLEISIPPSLRIAIIAKRTGGAAGDVTATLTWYEDL